MHPEAEFQLRRLVLTVSTFIFLTSTFAILSLQLLTQDSYPVRTSLTIYLFWFAALSVTGFIAALKRNATLITIFAVHLLVDSILLFIPRILFIRFSTSLPSLICSSFQYPQWVKESSIDGVSYLQNNLGDFASPALSEGSCTVWTWSLEAIFVGLIVIYMGLQVVLCARLFGYASWLSTEQRIKDVQGDEKVEVV